MLHPGAQESLVKLIAITGGLQFAAEDKVDLDLEALNCLEFQMLQFMSIKNLLCFEFFFCLLCSWMASNSKSVAWAQTAKVSQA